MKTMKRTVSLLICAVMVATTLFGAGLASLLKAEAADITIGGITQKRVVSNYETTYAEYQARFFTGASSNKPTNFVIPGLSEANNYIPQGMTYWAAKEWILISAYYNGTGKPSLIYALDAKTTNMVAVFTLYNQDGTINTAHGGGIAASEYNFYYADSASDVAYIPLSEFDVPAGTAKNVTIKGKIDLSGELNGVSTSYVCYSDGVLWTGNFYWSKDSSYSKTWTGTYPSVLIGYKLKGNSSAEEWENLQNTNLIVPSETTNATNGALTYSVDGNEHGYIDLTNTTSADGSSELNYNFGTVYLKHGTKYVLEFDQNGDFASNDIYFLRDGGTGSFSNVKYAYNGGVMTKASNGDGTYHYRLEFTPGTAIVGNADGNWGNGSDASGTYTLRFDNDTYSAGATNRITNLKVYEADTVGNITKLDGYDRAGNPSYVVPFNNDLDRLQYAMVYDGKIYLSRSWSRSASGNHIRELCIGEFDINVPGATALSVNGRNRRCNVVAEPDVTKFGGGVGNSKMPEMFYMSEALCVIDDYLYMFAESAAWKYNGEDSSNKCPEPIDVIWKIDQKEIMGETRHSDTTVTESYQKVKSLSEIADGEDYLIVHESSQVDPSTGKNIIYAVDSYGGYDGRKLPKQDAGTRANTGDSMGVVGYPISDYKLEGDNLYVSEEAEKRDSIHWAINGAGTSSMRIINKDGYFSKNMYLYFGSRLFAMTTSARTNLDRITLEKYDENGNFRLYYGGNANYYLWCNDGSNQALINTYTNYYQNHGITAYSPNYNELEEQAGTFHADAEYNNTDTGNLLGATVGTDMQMIQIYKRIIDPYASTEYSNIYTDLNAELQADGTYTVNFETYSNYPTQQINIGSVDRPTDYIILMDTSYSGSNSDTVGRQRFNDNSKVEKYLANKETVNKDKVKNARIIYEKAYLEGDNNERYYKDSDGKYYRLYLAVYSGGKDGSNWIGTAKYHLYYYLYFIDGNGAYNIINSSGEITQADKTYNDFKTIIQSKANYTADVNHTDAGDRFNVVLLNGSNLQSKGNYYYGPASLTSSYTRFDSTKATTEALIEGIFQKNSSNRVAICHYGSGSTSTGTDNTYFFKNDGSHVAYGSTDYSNTFFSNGSTASLYSLIENKVGMSSNNDYSYSNLGFEMVKNIIDSSKDENYLAHGNRYLCVIVIHDGGLGKDSATATEIANKTIAQAKEVKNRGAYVYSVKIGSHSYTETSPFDISKYLQLISSEYKYADSMNEWDVENPDNTFSYTHDTASTTPGYHEYSSNATAQEILNNLSQNYKDAPVVLDTDSVIKQTLTDVFKIPENPTVTVRYARSQVDGLERVYFSDPVAAPSGVSATYDSTSKTITAKGYDYSSNYVSTVHNGNKLIVSISGVEFNPSATDNNISDYDKTAVYENETAAANNNAVKYFPNDTISIKEYTHVLDYGIPMCETVNGTPVSVDSLPQKQTTHKTEYSTEDIGVNISGNSLLYQFNTEDSTAEEMTSKGYVLVRKNDGTYEWVRFNVVPASNVLYEESSLNLDGSGSVSWSQQGTAGNNYQSISSNNDVYGYDDAYNNTNQYSNGTVLTAEVNSTNKKSDKATFEFTGTGFDLVSACGPNTGVEVITVKQGETIKKVFIIDTYYNDSTYGTLYQVPIVSYSDAHGTYTVETTAAYLSFAGALHQGTVQTASIDGTEIEASSAQLDAATASELLAQLGMEELAGEDVEVIWMDDNSIFNGGTGAQGSTVSTQAAGDSNIPLVSYIDGFRVYNPLTDEQAAKYYPASEQGAKYYNIIGSLISGKGNISGDANSWLAYVEGGNGKFSFADYSSNGGPKNEVYLSSAGGNGLAFSIEIPQNVVASARVMLSMRSASGTPNVKINGYDVDVISSTEMYYDITNILIESGQITSAGGSVTITINNNGGGLLALDNLKLVNCDTGTLSTNSISDVSAMMSAPSVHIGLESLTSSSNTYSYDYDNSTADPEGEVNPEPEQPNAIDAVLNRIVTFLQNAFEFVKTAFVKFIGFFDLLKF